MGNPDDVFLIFLYAAIACLLVILVDGWFIRPQRDPAKPVLRIHLIYLDGDPLEFVADVARREPQWRVGGRHYDTSRTEEALFAGPLRAIVPWRWDRFAETNAARG